MKLRRLIAALLAFVLLISDSPLMLLDIAWAADETTTIMATDNRLLLSAAAGVKEEPVGTNVIYCKSHNDMRWDKPTIATLRSDVIGQFNLQETPWIWFAYKVNAAAAGTYTLGVKVNNINLTGHTNIPLCVNNEVYTLTYTEKPQQVTAQVKLPAGEHVVVMFMPMPAERTAAVTNNGTYYPWCNVESMIVDSDLTVMAAPTAAEVEASFYTTVSAADTDNVRLSETISNKTTYVARTDQSTMKVDSPSIATLLEDAIGEFNKEGEQWNWFAYKISVPKDGTYNLGAYVINSKYASYQIPLCVNNSVYTLSYTAKNQQQTTEVTLPAGEHVVTLFMPMPATEAAISGNEWNDYHYCDVESVIVDSAVTVMAAPTELEVEACFSKTVSAVDKNYMLHSAAVWEKDNSGILEFNARDAVKADLPFIDSLLTDVSVQFNKEGEEWGWFAYKVNAPAEGTYSLGVKTNACRNAPYKIPLYVNGKVYALAYNTTGTAQCTVQVTLAEGDNVVLMFMPMPQNADSDTGEAWVDYPWCNVQSMIVDPALEVKSAPTEAEVESFFQTTVNAGDANYVTYDHMAEGGYKSNGNIADGVSRSKVTMTLSELIAADGNFHYLDKSGLPYVQYIVDAETAGTYAMNIAYSMKAVEAAEGDATAFAVIVNDKVYKVEHTKATSAEENFVQTIQVELQKGRNVIRTTGLLKGTKWFDSSWANHRYITIEAGPTFVAVNQTSVNGSADGVLSNQYTRNETSLGGSVRGLMQQDLPTIESIADSVHLFNRWPFASVKVTAEKEGYYDITLSVDVKASAADISKQIGMLVDGAVYGKPFSTAHASGDVAATTIDASVYLTKGEHVLTFFTPMPKAADESIKGNGTYYPWLDYKTLTFSAGLTVSETAPTLDEIRSKFDPKVSVLDKEYILWSDTVKYDTDKNPAFVERGDGDGARSDNPSVETLLADAVGEFNKSGEEWSWIAYKVSAPQAGEYTLGVETENCKLPDTEIGLNSYTIPMYVNGKVYSLTYDANGKLVTTKVTLAQGENVVVVFMPMPAQEADKTDNKWNDYPWCNLEALWVDTALTLVKGVTEAEVESCFQTVIQPESDSVLANKFDAKDGTVGDGKLTEADATQLRADQPSIEALPYTGNLIGNWPFMSMKVTAEKDGTYAIRVNANVKKADGVPCQLAMLVDGKFHTLRFDAPASNTATVEIDALLELTAGDHVITFFIPMPEKASEVISNVWNQYPWVNFNSILLDKRLSISTDDSGNIELPTLADITSPLGTMIWAGDENSVLANLYTDNGNTLGGGSFGYIRLGGYYIGGLDMSQLNNIPHAAMEVTVAADGTYTILVEGATDGGTQPKQIALLVDGVPQTVSFAENEGLGTAGKAVNVTLSAEVTLTAGKHLLVFTSPMPVDAAGEGNGTVYPWFDFEKFHFEKGLTVSDDLAASETVSVADVEKISKNWVNFQDDPADEDTLSDHLSADTTDIRYHKMSIEKLPETGLSRVPHISFDVTAEADDWYDVCATISLNNAMTSKHVAVIVDGETVYKIEVRAASGQQLVRAYIPLTAGDHTIAITSVLPETAEEAAAVTDETKSKAYPWFNFHSVTVSGRLTVKGGKSNPLKDKSVLFVGDSITHGLGNTAKGISWAHYISKWNGMDCDNAGIKGATISDLGNYIIRHQLMTNAGNDYDYVIMHGGINDAAAQIGEISDSFNVAAFDTSTYAGGLETMFYYAYENFPNAKLGYIVNYATPNADTDQWKGTDDTSAYFEVGKQICEKWGIPYIDLYFGTTEDGKSYSYDILQVDTNTNLKNKNASEIHLSDEGYRVISPYIEAWMKTLGENENPLEAEDTGKYVSADDEKVLSGGFTAGGIAVSEDGSSYTETNKGAGMLISRVYTGMEEDEASIELLPYAKELLGDWAFASIKVNAAEDGDYKIKVEVSAKTTATLGMLVDGQVYTLSYTLGEGEKGYRFLEQTLHLTKGEHYITVTAAMPVSEVGTVGDGWNVYPWTNISAFIVDSGLEVMEKPALSDVTAKLLTVSDMGETVINAADQDRVLAGDGFTANDNKTADTTDDDFLGVVTKTDEEKGVTATVNDARWDSLTLEQVTCDSLERMPYFAIKVTAAADGYYDILLDISTNNKTVSDQIGLLVDGKDLQVLPFELETDTKVKATVYLKAGTHTLTFTTPMPETVAEMKAYLEKNNLERGNGTTHPWMDVKTVTLSEGLKAEAKPTTAEIENPFYNRVEAEDGKYVVYNNYESEPEQSKAASGGHVIGGQQKWIFEQTFEDLKVWLDAKHNSYVEYAVVAPADGEYEIRVGFLAGKDAEENPAKPYIAVIANGEVYKAQFTKKWGEIDKVKLTVKLKEGLNIIRCTSFTTEQECYKVKTWINHDFLDLDKRLTAVAVEKEPVKVEAEDSKHFNRFEVQDGGKDEAASGKVLGSVDRKYVNGWNLTLDQISTDLLRKIPYVSFTVNAPQSGYYPISMHMSGDGRMSRGTIGVLVDGNMNVAHYARTNKTTDGARVDVLVYLTEGEHVLTFTSPIKENADVKDDFTYNWCNFDYLTLYHGLTLAQEQKAPTTEPAYVQVEVEDHAMFNQNSNNGSAAGNAYYKSLQTVAEMLANGIDGTKTPYAELKIHAAQAGTYTVYLGVKAGMTAGNTVDQTEAVFVVDVNGKLQTQKLQVAKTERKTVITMELSLNAGENTVRLTHFSKDCQLGGTTWIDFDYIEMPETVSDQLRFAKNGGKLEAEDGAYAGYSEFASSSYSGGKYLGDPNYDDVDEGDITFEKLDPADVGELPHVTYRVIAEKAGKYTLTVGFAAGMHNYPREEIAAGDTGGFAVIVNGETKQLIEFGISSNNSKMARMITVELQEGENEITFTTALAEYIIDRMPRNDETYRLIWIDHDYLVLSEGLSAMGGEAEDYDIEDSDYDHAQIDAKPSAGGQGTEPTVPGDTTVSDPAGAPDVLVIVWVLVTACVAAALIILLVYKKRRKKDSE